MVGTSLKLDTKGSSASQSGDLCGAPLLYAWFLEWTTSGTPPAASARLTAPTGCPP